MAQKAVSPGPRPKTGRLPFFELLNLVQALEEKQIGDLRDDVYRVGDAARPESVPDTINSIFGCRQ
jgi:hypothetical protein